MARYYQVHVLHTTDGGVTLGTDIIGVVADSEEDAAEVCTSALRQATVLKVVERGHVRFIRHTMVGPKTKTYVNKEQVNVLPSNG
jgi:hypothetical protein